MTKNGLPELLAPAGDPEKLKIAVEYGADAVYKEGLKIYTTLDMDMQKAADATITGLSLGETTTIEAEPVPITLNQGKTWIGWASSNHGGKLKLS